MFRCLLLLSAVTVLSPPVLADIDAVESSFLSPPSGTRPGCYWYWINDNISKEGIAEMLLQSHVGDSSEGYLIELLPALPDC